MSTKQHNCVLTGRKFAREFPKYLTAGVLVPVSKFRQFEAVHHFPMRKGRINVYPDKGFGEHFSNKVEERVPAASLASYTLLRALPSISLILELGGKCEIEISLAHFWELLSRQLRNEQGEQNVLAMDGAETLFCIPDVEEILQVVSVMRKHGDGNEIGWYIAIGSLGSKREVPAGSQIYTRVFSRPWSDKCLTSLAASA